MSRPSGSVEAVVGFAVFLGEDSVLGGFSVMDSQPFQYARAKVGRARRHQGEFVREAAAFFAKRPYITYLTEERVGPPVQQGGHLKLHFITYTREPPPADLSLILGDCVHNLRVALDVLANEAIAIGNVIPKGVYFPFAKDPEDFEKQLKEKMKGATSDTRDLVRSLKPWRGGNEGLRGLHDLDIQDKHIAPLTAASTASSPSFRWTGTEFDFSTARLSRFDPALFAKPPSPPGRMIGILEDADYELTLGKGLPLAGKPVIETLSHLTELVESVIETFEAHFLGRKSSRSTGDSAPT